MKLLVGGDALDGCGITLWSFDVWNNEQGRDCGGKTASGLQGVRRERFCAFGG